MTVMRGCRQAIIGDVEHTAWRPGMGLAVEVE